ncbi:hypothetical protein [Gordonia caeni]|uniref:Uncharacterized protein n=1 Tax=Gordonia caeni TaxID=1007097 RepID=A0ABP7PGY3_9ACTN
MITRAHGLLAGTVSVILGIGAHGVAGGFRPDAGQLLLLAVIALGVAAVRTGQVDRERRRREHGRLDGSWTSIAAVLIGGQLASHTVLTAVGSHAGHQHDSNTAAMAAWHVAALPVAVAALGAVDWLLRVLGSTVSTLRAIGRPLPAAPSHLRAVPAAVVLHDLAPRLAVGMRAPPVAG